MSTDVYRALLVDFGQEVKRRALEAKNELLEITADTKERAFEEGRLLAFNELVSLLQQSAQGLGIDLEEMHLKDIEPDRDLIVKLSLSAVTSPSLP